MRPAIKVGLSTASVYPLRTEAAFEYAAELGYDGVELMVWGETVSQDIGAISQMSRRYDMPVLSPPIPRTVRFAEASASGSSVMAGRKNKGATAYRDLAKSLLKHWRKGKPLPTFTPDLD